MSGVRLSRRLVLEAPQNVADGAGGFNAAWAVLGILWGEVVPGSGRDERPAGPVRPRGVRRSYRASSACRVMSGAMLPPTTSDVRRGAGGSSRSAG